MIVGLVVLLAIVPLMLLDVMPNMRNRMNLGRWEVMIWLSLWITSYFSPTLEYNGQSLQPLVVAIILASCVRLVWGQWGQIPRMLAGALLVACLGYWLIRFWPDSLTIWMPLWPVLAFLAAVVGAIGCTSAGSSVAAAILGVVLTLLLTQFGGLTYMPGVTWIELADLSACTIPMTVFFCWMIHPLRRNSAVLAR